MFWLLSETMQRRTQKTPQRRYQSFLVSSATQSALKLVDNLARPQGNVTGLSNFSAELVPKRLEILKEMIPRLSRVAILANANASISRLYLDLSHAAAIQLGLTVQTFEVRSPKELRRGYI